MSRWWSAQPDRERMDPSLTGTTERLKQLVGLRKASPVRATVVGLPCRARTEKKVGEGIGNVLQCPTRSLWFYISGKIILSLSCSLSLSLWAFARLSGGAYNGSHYIACCLDTRTHTNSMNVAVSVSGALFGKATCVGIGLPFLSAESLFSRRWVLRTHYGSRTVTW